MVHYVTYDCHGDAKHEDSTNEHGIVFALTLLVQLVPVTLWHWQIIHCRLFVVSAMVGSTRHGSGYQTNDRKFKICQMLCNIG